jgi:hypothetical protein
MKTTLGMLIYRKIFISLVTLTYLSNKGLFANFVSIIIMNRICTDTPLNGEKIINSRRTK